MFPVCHTKTLRDAARDDQLRLIAGGTGVGYEYGRLEIFLRGIWSNICDLDRFTPASGQVACRALGYDGCVPLEFLQELSVGARTRKNGAFPLYNTPSPVHMPTLV